MATMVSDTPRRYPSPAAQQRLGERARIRIGLIVATVLMIASAAALWKLPAP